MSKIYTIKISLYTDLFRIIDIRDNASLYDLSSTILKAFNFDMDHSFGFYDNINDLYKSKEVYELFVDSGCSDNPDAKSVKNTVISTAFSLKKQMLFLFDYGDEWIFHVECQDISEAIPKTRYPKIIKKLGKSPKQY